MIRLKRMKSILRSFLINGLALWLVSQALPGSMNFSRGTETLLFTAFVLGIINLFVRPLLKLFLLPINLLTLGAFRWVVNVLSLYLVTVVVTDFKIQNFFFPGFSYNVVTLPSLFLTGFWAFVLVSFSLSIISHFLFWLSR